MYQQSCLVFHLMADAEYGACGGRIHVAFATVKVNFLGKHVFGRSATPLVCKAEKNAKQKDSVEKHGPDLDGYIP